MKRKLKKQIFWQEKVSKMFGPLISSSLLMVVDKTSCNNSELVTLQSALRKNISSFFLIRHIRKRVLVSFFKDNIFSFVDRKRFNFYNLGIMCIYYNSFFLKLQNNIRFFTCLKNLIVYFKVNKMITTLSVVLNWNAYNPVLLNLLDKYKTYKSLQISVIEILYYNYFRLLDYICIYSSKLNNNNMNAKI